jgi:hypothetical protein
MPSIFTDKKLLHQEYKRIFFDNLTDVQKIKKCLCGRYDKKTITDESLAQLFTNNHKVIYDFVGLSNELRIKYFFGDVDDRDSRDGQIRLIDKLVLDSIHFEVMRALLSQLNNEYSANKDEIDKIWKSEVDAHAYLGPLEPIFIIQYVFKQMKKQFFDDLIFPSKSNVSLFSLRKEVITPNKNIFKNWIPKTDSPSSTPLYLMALFFILIAALLVVPVALSSAFGLLSAAVGAGIIFIITSLVTLAGIYYVTKAKNNLEARINNNADADYTGCSSYFLMTNIMPTCFQAETPLKPGVYKSIYAHHPEPKVQKLEIGPEPASNLF